MINISSRLDVHFSSPFLLRLLAFVDENCIFILLCVVSTEERCSERQMMPVRKVKNYMNENSRNPNLMGVHQFQDMVNLLYAFWLKLYYY